LKRLFRSTTDSFVAGVFGGLGEAYGVDPNALRLIGVFLTIITGFVPMLVTYVVACFIVPQDSPDNE
jgi:phage shock protein C